MTLRAAVVCGLAFLASACVGLEEIQRQPLVRALYFEGSAREVATCVQRRLGAKLVSDSLPERFFVYDSVKGMSARGLTHYAITIAAQNNEQGYAEWRILDPKPAGYARTPLAYEATQLIWHPVEVCAGNPNRIGAAQARVPAAAGVDQTIFGDDYGENPITESR